MFFSVEPPLFLSESSRGAAVSRRAAARSLPIEEKDGRDRDPETGKDSRKDRKVCS